MPSDKAVADLVGAIQDPSDKVRTGAWFGAGKVGAPAIEPMARLMSDKRLEVARGAKNALWQIARHAGRPDARKDRPNVLAELLALLRDDQPATVRREVLWMLSEIGGDESVAAIARVLADRDLREDARCALERLPGEKPVAALSAALAAAPKEFKIHVAQSLRARGVAVGGLPCRKLTPTRPTRVKPAK